MSHVCNNSEIELLSRDEEGELMMSNLMTSEMLEKTQIVLEFPVNVLFTSLKILVFITV